MTEGTPASSFAYLHVGKITSRTVFAGRAAGEADHPRLSELARRTPASGVLIVDLDGIEVLSSSYFLAALWPLWEGQAVEFFPVLANVPDAGADDIKLVLKDKDAAAWQAAWDVQGGLKCHSQLGVLDVPLQQTLDYICSRGEGTAADLTELDRSIGVTAWSNRLAALYQHRLLRKRKDGRRLVYAPSWKE